MVRRTICFETWENLRFARLTVVRIHQQRDSFHLQRHPSCINPLIVFCADDPVRVGIIECTLERRFKPLYLLRRVLSIDMIQLK